MHLACQRDVRARYLDEDLVAVPCRTALDRRVDVGLHDAGLRLVLDADLVADAGHAHQGAYRIRRRLLLVLPVDLAAERDPAALHLNLDGAGFDGRRPVEDVPRGLADVAVRTPRRARELDLHLD